MFDISLKSATASDVQKLIGLVEDERLEFKVALSTKPESYIKEIIAFANTGGGLMVVGIDEDDSRPAKAIAVKPIADCAALADSLSKTIQNNIEPRLVLVECEAVLIDGDAGVIAVRVSASPYGPHRSATSKEVYTRQRDRSERADMTRVQDLVREVDRRQAGIEDRFAARSADLAQHWRGSGCVWAFHMVAIPLTPLHIDLPLSDFHRTTQGAAVEAHWNPREGYQPPELHNVMQAVEERPIIRGVSRGDHRQPRRQWVNVWRNGEVELVFLRDLANYGGAVYASWLVRLFCNGLIRIERARLAAQRPWTEYAVQVVMRTAPTGRTMWLKGYNRDFDDGKAVEWAEQAFPRYVYGAPERRSLVVNAFHEDLFNSVGETFSHKLDISFPDLDPPKAATP